MFVLTCMLFMVFGFVLLNVCFLILDVDFCVVI